MSRNGILILILGAALLGGCSSQLSAPPQSVGLIIDDAAVRPDEAHCRSVARERADDAIANGYGLGIEDSVYQETYRDCLAWRRRDSVK